MTLGSAERFMHSFEEAEALIERLRHAQEEVVDYEYELVKKECNVG